MRFCNDGNTAQRLKTKGSPGRSKWTVRYVDYATGTDISSSVTGAGWTTPSLVPGAYRRVTVEVTPLLKATANAVLNVLVTATSTGDATRSDAVKASTTALSTTIPDGQIYNGSTYLGDNIYNTSGTGQTHASSANVGKTAAYTIRFYNDGNTADTFRLTGSKGSSAWLAKYVDHATGTDITNAVKGVGWTTPSLAAGGYRAVRLEVTPLAGAAGNSTRPILITGTSSGDATKRDVVKRITPCAPDSQPDGLIYNGAAYIGDGIYNTTGSGQTHALTARLGACLLYTSPSPRDS